MDKRTQRPKGDCTVSFDESETAKAAIKWYDGKCFGVRHAHRACRAAPAALPAPRAFPPCRGPHPAHHGRPPHITLPTRRLDPSSTPNPHPHPHPYQNFTNTKLSISSAKRPDGASFGGGKGGKGGGKGY